MDLYTSQYLPSFLNLELRVESTFPHNCRWVCHHSRYICGHDRNTVRCTQRHTNRRPHFVSELSPRSEFQNRKCCAIRRLNCRCCCCSFWAVSPFSQKCCGSTFLGCPFEILKSHLWKLTWLIRGGCVTLGKITLKYCWCWRRSPSDYWRQFCW